jgi:hypothetical protein
MTLRVDSLKQSRYLLPLLILAALLLNWTLGPGAGSHPTVRMPDLRRVALAFEPNVGQTDPQVQFVSHAAGATIYYTTQEVVLALSTPANNAATSAPPVARLQFVGANPAPAVTAAERLPGTVNYFQGQNPAQWRTNVATYGGVTYAALYPGVNLHYEGTNGQLKGTYAVAAGADPSRIRWQYAGAQQVTVDGQGNLQILLSAAQGDQPAVSVTEQTPLAWQDSNGQRVPVPVAYAVAADRTIGFTLGSYDAALPLTIDPALTYSTYLGGSVADAGLSIAADSAGNAYVSGSTASTNFPTLNPRQPATAGGSDAFVTKFDANGTVVFSSYLGGSGDDGGQTVRVDNAGAVYVGGRTSSGNFPTTANAYHPTSGGNVEAFATKISADGQTLVYSTYFGGSISDYAWGLALDGNNNIYLVGQTNSSNTPTRNGYQTTLGGSNDAFLAKFNPSGSGDSSLLYATYFGGTADDFAGGSGLLNIGHGVAADNSGNAYFAGSTMSNNLPTRNGYQSTWAGNGNPDAWMAKINTTATGDPSLVYATYLGNTGQDSARDIAIDGAGNAYLTGNTNAANFPTRNAYGACTNGNPFVAKINPALTGDPSLIYSTCFGPNGGGAGTSIAVDAGGNAIITGYSSSTSFPLVSPIQNYQGGIEAIVVKVGPAGNTVLFSTYLGGTANDDGWGVAVDGTDNIYVTGETASTNFITQNPAYPNNAGQTDAFVTKINSNAGPTPCPIQFEDAGPSTSFYTYIRCLACRGIVGGYPCGGPNEPCVAPENQPYFRPSANVTRGQVSKIVAAAAGFTDPIPSTQQTFEDIAPNSTFWIFIERLSAHGAIGGYPCGGAGEPCVSPGNRPYFRANNNVTRGQLSKIVAIAAGYTETPTGQTFEDVPPTGTFYLYVERVAARGIVGGYPCGGAGEPCVAPGNRAYFRPNNTATRGQMSKIAANAFYPNCQTPASGQLPQAPQK